jgi:hypothetical protein
MRRSADSQPPVIPQVLLDLLVDGRVHEHGQDDRRRPVDGHGHGGVGSHRSKPEYSFFMSSTVAMDTPEFPIRP